MTVYLDCNATTPLEPRVGEVVGEFLVNEFGNAGSRTHEFGTRAKRAVNEARSAVGDVVGADPSEVVFTSGATESNNLAIVGLADALLEAGRRHILSTAIEHKAVIGPLEVLSDRGFEVELLRPDESGRITVSQVEAVLRPDTGLVSIMQVNNETGVQQPIAEVAERLKSHPAYLHVDAAQGFGKVSGIESRRIDLLSVSGHKLYAPKGIGALIARRRGHERPPLKPLLVGGGQERGLRAGTLPVHLIAGFGVACRLALSERESRVERCFELRSQLMECFSAIPHTINGEPDHTVPSTVNVALEGVDAEAAIVCLKDIVAISNGAACTSASYETSHVLKAMGLGDDRIRTSLRWSWCHMTPDIPVDAIRKALRPLMA